MPRARVRAMMRLFRSSLVGVTIALGVLVDANVAAAAPLSKKVTERVVDSAIDSGLEALTRPENQRRLGLLLSSPAMTGGVHDIAFALIDGVLDGIEGRVKFDFDFDTVAMWKGFDGAMRKHVAPAVGNVTRTAVDAAMSEALSEENGVRIESLAAHATHGVIKGLAQGLREDLGPALAHVIEHQLAPAGAAAMENHIMPAAARGLRDPEMQIAIEMTMSAVARSLVRGGDAGIETAKAEGQAAGGEGGVMGFFGDRLTLGLNIAVLVTAALASLLILLAVLLIRSNRGQQRLSEQGNRREQELLAVVDQLDAEDTKVDKESLRELLQQHLRNR